MSNIIYKAVIKSFSYYNNFSFFSRKTNIIEHVLVTIYYKGMYEVFNTSFVRNKVYNVSTVKNIISIFKTFIKIIRLQSLQNSNFLIIQGKTFMKNFRNCCPRYFSSRDARLVNFRRTNRPRGGS